MKPIVYIDMDGVVADFDKAFPAVAEKNWIDGQNKVVPENFFCELELIKGAKEGLQALDSLGYDLYFLSTPQWSNPNCWKEKRIWVELHFGELMFKRLILTHNKGLLKGDYLIDDRNVNGVENFEGKHIHFGSEEFPDWISVVAFLKIERMKDAKTYFKEKMKRFFDDSVESMLE
jgi:5'-nucleotidase